MTVIGLLLEDRRNNNGLDRRDKHAGGTGGTHVRQCSSGGEVAGRVLPTAAQVGGETSYNIRDGDCVNEWRSD